MRLRTTRADGGRRPRVLRRALAVAVGASTAVAGAVLPVAAASAAEDVITVTNTATCDAPGSFEDALLQANASTNPDGVRIVFDEALAGTGGIVFSGVDCKMHDGLVGAPGGNHQTPGLLGARFVIDSQVPVSVDFTNLDEIGTTTDADFAGIYVRSDNVALENLANLTAGAAGLAIEGTGVTVSGFGFSDPDTAIAETGVALLDGATDVTIRDSSFASQWWSSILIDGSLSQPTTVSNIVIDNVTSRGVESGVGHIDIEDNAVVNGLTVTNSAFGALGDETHTAHAVYFNTALEINGINFSGNTVERGAGAEKNVFYFENALGSVFNDVTLDGNTFTGVSEVQPLSRIIGLNTATWNGLRVTNNEATFTRGLLIDGAVNDSAITGNVLTSTQEPSLGAINIANQAGNVTISDNFLDTVWALDGIRIQGSAANGVVIENNRIHDFHANVSRSAIAIIAPGADNVVRGNELIQHLDRAGADLPATLANHWAVYVWLEASAASGADTVGWSILDNSIDGFGGNPAIASQAPITNNAIGKTLITGNTFGPNTRGSFETETENLGHWFLWNDHGLANNRVQTFRADDVRYTGTAATFTAVQPDALAGNNAAAAPVTLHVYWTADDHAEEYLGAIEDVQDGDTLSIATSRTSGSLRLQTVDAGGFTSQYSATAEGVFDPEPPVTSTPPTVAGTTQDTVTGSGKPTATIEVLDVGGNVVGTATVAADGTWSVSGLECGTDYVAVQIVEDVRSAATAFTTAACDVDPVVPDAPKVTDVTRDVVTGTGEPEAIITVRDGDLRVVLTTVVGADGTWRIDASKLKCGTEYTVTQTVDGVPSEATSFTTLNCPTTQGTGGGAKGGTDDDALSTTGGNGAGALIGLAVMLLAASGASLLILRRRRA